MTIAPPFPDGRLTLHPLRALRDNYVYLLVDEESRLAAAVDPGEAAPVDAALARLGVRLAAIWCTHHHFDHTGAVAELASRYGDVAVVGSEADRGQIPEQTRYLIDGDRFPWAGREVEVLHLPAHTLGHVAYRIGRHVFPGDTLFGAGCGRLFEGTPAQMHAALSRLRALPDDTLVWCGHEYTLQNLRFATELEPGNAALAARLARVAALAEPVTVPLSLPEERATNPFLRWDAPAIAAWAGGGSGVDVFAAVRRAKDVWRG